VFCFADLFAQSTALQKSAKIVNKIVNKGSRILRE